MSLKIMAGKKILNKSLWINLICLRFLSKPDAPVKFLLDKSPFEGYEDDDEDEDRRRQFLQRDRYLIVGRILPNSDIYKDGAFQIEIILTSDYPEVAPRVRFLTPVYHVNIESDGTFCHQLLSNVSRWKPGTSLVEVIRVVVNFLDNPDPDYPVNYEIGREYIDNKEKFNRKAKEMVAKHALPRT